MGALPTLETPILDIPHLVRIPAAEHLGHEASIVTRLVARVGTGEPVPVLGKDLFEDVPGRHGCCSHRPHHFGVLAAPGKFESKRFCSAERVMTRCYVTYFRIFVVLYMKEPSHADP